MTMSITEHLIAHGTAGVGCHAKQTAITVDVTVSLGGFSAESGLYPRIAAQRDYIEEAIRRFMQTPEYKQGLHHAALGMPIDGALHEIGNPVSRALLEESFNKHVYGKLAPRYGRVNPLTFCQLSTLYGLDGSNGLRFNGAHILWDTSIELGWVRWTY
jgi:hypothetical protein